MIGAARAAWVLACVAAASACAAKDEPAPRDGKKESAAVSEAPDFQFQYLIAAMPPPIPKELAIEGLEARLTLRRSEPESEGATIGFFGEKLKPEDLKPLEAATPGKLEYDGPPIAPGTPTIYVKLKSGARTTELRLPIDPDALLSVAALTGAIEKIEKRLMERPLRALKLELAPHPEPIGTHNEESFKVALLNPGREALRIDLAAVKWKLETAPPPPPPDPKVTALPTVWAAADGLLVKPEAIEIKPGGRAEIDLKSGVANPGKLLARVRVALPGGEGSIEGETISNTVAVEAR